MYRTGRYTAVHIEGALTGTINVYICVHSSDTEMVFSTLLAPVFFRVDVGEVNGAIAVDDIDVSFR